MAKKEETQVEETIVAKTERELAWERFLANYAKENPEKYANKKAKGEFDRIPDSFTGVNALNIKG